jgi:hypothetical protein
LELGEVRERVTEYAEGLANDAREWTEGRNLWVRLPLLAYLLYAGARHTADPMYRSWFAGITLAIHETGHILFSLFGDTLMILGGTILQLFAPLAAAVYLLLRQRDYFGFAVGAAWLAFSTWEMATYMADANKDQLPLVGFGDNPAHDWGTLFTRWHVLNHCDSIATVFRVGAWGFGPGRSRGATPPV